MRITLVSFGCDLTALVAPGRRVETRTDCPAVSDDFDTAWTFITRRVDRLLESDARCRAPKGLIAPDVNGKGSGRRRHVILLKLLRVSLHISLSNFSGFAFQIPPAASNTGWPVKQ